MPRGYCAPCLDENVERATSLVVDGQYLCATHVAKVRPESPFQPQPETAGEALWGDPPLPAPTHTSVMYDRLCSRGCGRPPHAGRCARDGASLPLPVTCDSPASPPEPFPTAEVAPALPIDLPPLEIVALTPPLPGSTVAPEIEIVPLSAVPAMGGMSTSRVSLIVAAMLRAGADEAVKVTCRDVAHARKTAEQALGKARAAGVPLRSRVDHGTLFLWRKKVEGAV